MSFLVALRKELLEQLRTLRVLVTLVVFAIFGLGSPLLARLTPEFFKLLPEGEAFAALIPPPALSDAVAQYLKNLSQFGVILALLMGMGAVAGEKDKGTLAMVVVKPMPRGAFLLAKFAALGATFGVAVGLAAVAGYYYTTILFGPMDVAGWTALNGLLWLFLLVHVALTLLASTLTRSQVVAGGVGFAAVVVLSIVGAMPRIGEYLPGQLLSWGAALVAGRTDTWWPAFGVSAALIAFSLLLAWAALNRQEL